MNHRINEPETDLPWEGNAEGFNRYDSLSERFRLYTARAPNIIVVDFWRVGDVRDFMTEVNWNKAGGGSATAVETMPWIEGGE